MKGFFVFRISYFPIEAAHIRTVHIGRTQNRFDSSLVLFLIFFFGARIQLWHSILCIRSNSCLLFAKLPNFYWYVGNYLSLATFSALTYEFCWMEKHFFAVCFFVWHKCVIYLMICNNSRISFIPNCLSNAPNG